MDQDLTDFGRKILAEQPFSMLLGAELALLTDRRVEIRLPVTESLRQQHGFVHGGVISYLADNSLTFAGGSALGSEAVVTSEFKINYVRPATGDLLIARAEVIGLGSSQSVVRCEIYASTKGEEKLCAAAQGTIAALPRK